MNRVNLRHGSVSVTLLRGRMRPRSRRCRRPRPRRGIHRARSSPWRAARASTVAPRRRRTSVRRSPLPRTCVACASFSPAPESACAASPASSGARSLAERAGLAFEPARPELERRRAMRRPTRGQALRFGAFARRRFCRRSHRHRASAASAARPASAAATGDRRPRDDPPPAVATSSKRSRARSTTSARCAAAKRCTTWATSSSSATSIRAPN